MQPANTDPFDRDGAYGHRGDLSGVSAELGLEKRKRQLLIQPLYGVRGADSGFRHPYAYGHSVWHPGRPEYRTEKVEHSVSIKQIYSVLSK